METFTEMRNRFMNPQDCWKWSRKVATLATRYYKNIDTSNDLRQELTPDVVEEIILLR